MGRFRLVAALVSALAAAAVGRPAAAPPQPPKALPRMHGFVGEVVGVFPRSGRLLARETLRAGSRKETAFEVDRTTRVSLVGRAASISDIHRGDHVTIKYWLEPKDRHRAVSIQVTPIAGPGGALRAPAGADEESAPAEPFPDQGAGLFQESW